MSPLKSLVDIVRHGDLLIVTEDRLRTSISLAGDVTTTLSKRLIPNGGLSAAEIAAVTQAHGEAVTSALRGLRADLKLIENSVTGGMIALGGLGSLYYLANFELSLRHAVGAALDAGLILIWRQVPGIAMRALFRRALKAHS